MNNHQTPSFSSVHAPVFSYDRWIVGPPVLQAGPEGSFDDVAVKDPSIVFFKDLYHLFYTSKYSKETAARMKAQGLPVSISRSGAGYLSAPSLEELKNAPRYDVCEIVGDVIIAPQIFFFEPRALWFLIAHKNIGDSFDLQPIYMTNPDILDVRGWSKPKALLSPAPTGIFWIDFRVICDDVNAHLFYTDHRGSLFRMECPLEKFPEGLEEVRSARISRAPDYGLARTVLTEWGIDEQGPWRLHEGLSVYAVQSTGTYLALGEAVRPHPLNPLHWDSRNRFMIAFVADRIEGPWARAERHPNEFAGDPGRVFHADGAPSRYGQVSHFTLLRSGYDQKMEIKDFQLELLYQAFDARGIGPDYVYDDLPWELAVMRNS